MGKYDLRDAVMALRHREPELRGETVLTRALNEILDPSGQGEGCWPAFENRIGG